MILAGLAYKDVGQPRFFLFPGNTEAVVSGSTRGASPAYPCKAGTTAFGNRTRSQPRQRGCSRGLGCYPNKQRNRHPAATPDVCFEHLWEQMHCLPSSAPPQNPLPLHLRSQPCERRYVERNEEFVHSFNLAGIHLAQDHAVCIVERGILHRQSRFP